MTFGRVLSGKRMTPNSARDTNALEAVRSLPVRTYTANVVTVT